MKLKQKRRKGGKRERKEKRKDDEKETDKTGKLILYLDIKGRAN